MATTTGVCKQREPQSAASQQAAEEGGVFPVPAPCTHRLLATSWAAWRLTPVEPATDTPPPRLQTNHDCTAAALRCGSLLTSRADDADQLLARPARHTDTATGGGRGKEQQAGSQPRRWRRHGAPYWNASRSSGFFNAVFTVCSHSSTTTTMTISSRSSSSRESSDDSTHNVPPRAPPLPASSGPSPRPHRPCRPVAARSCRAGLTGVARRARAAARHGKQRTTSGERASVDSTPPA